MSNELIEKLHALADGELSAGEVEAVRSKLEDPQVKAAYDSIVLIKSMLGRQAATTPSPDLWARCKSRWDELDSSKRATNVVQKYAWGICAMFLVAIVSAGLVNRLYGGKVYAGDIANMAGTLTPISAPTTTDGDEMRSLLLRHLGSAPVRIPAAKYRLQGMRSGQMDGRRVIRFDLRDNDGLMALIAVENTTNVEGLSPGVNRFSRGQIDNLRCLSWVDGNVALFIIADRPYSELEQIASNIQVE